MDTMHELILKSWDGTSNVSYGGGEITHQQLALMRVLSELSLLLVVLG